MSRGGGGGAAGATGGGAQPPSEADGGGGGADATGGGGEYAGAGGGGDDGGPWPEWSTGRCRGARGGPGRDSRGRTSGGGGERGEVSARDPNPTTRVLYCQTGATQQTENNP